MENKLQLKVKYFDKNIKRLEKISQGDWIDLRAASDVIMHPGDFKLIPLGIAVELPEGYEAHIVPRSSTFKNFGIIQTNSMGIIDHSYCGNNDQWLMPAYCLENRHKDKTLIKKNDRICQFRIVKNQPTLKIKEVDYLDNEDRGGHGSTGVK